MSDHRLKRPRTDRVRVEDLVLHDVPEGRYRIPSFGRLWRWTRDDILDLFDSLWQGFPIGVILCWTRPAEAESIQMGEFRCEVEARASAQLIVDGQQRVHTLVGVLRHPLGPDLHRRGSDFELYFDLERAQFCHRDQPGPPGPLWLPMNVVAESAAMSAWLDERELRKNQPEKYRLALELGRMVREHELLVNVLETDNQAAVRQLFARLNYTGRPLKETEVFDALHRGMGGAIEDLEHLQLEITDRGLGVLPRTSLLHVCLAVVGAEFKGRLDGRRTRAPLGGSQLERVRPALISALELLRDHADIPTGSDLPHALGLCAVAILCDRFKVIDARNAELLSRFLWRGSASDALNGRDQELAGRVYKAARLPSGSLSECVQGLLQSVPRVSPSPVKVERWNPTTGRSRLYLLAMEAMRPRDLRTGRELGRDDLRAHRGALEVVRVFGKERLPDERWRRSLGNHLLHPKIAELPNLGALLEDLTRPSLFSPRSPALLESHAITLETWTFLEQGDLEGFVRAREARLREKIDEHIASRARWDDPDLDRPPLSALLEGDDDD